MKIIIYNEKRSEKMRLIELYFSDGDFIVTRINCTKAGTIRFYKDNNYYTSKKVIAIKFY